MFESVLITAFLMGLLSAFSLPLGTLTSFTWQPSDRVNAVIMSFGGGALLAALAIDLVAKSVTQGHIFSLSIGALSGGLLFIVLNELLNNYGGFLRKASTTYYHLRRNKHKQMEKILSSIKQANLFKELPQRDYKALASSIYQRTLKKGELLYQQGDPSDNLYIIADGSIGLSRPHVLDNPLYMSSKQAVGWLAFLTGTPFYYNARALVDTNVWAVPRSAFTSHVKNSHTLLQRVHRELYNNNVVEYLKHIHRLNPADIHQWLRTSGRSLMSTGEYPPPFTSLSQRTNFLDALHHFKDLPLFRDISDDTAAAIAERIIYRKYTEGESVILPGDIADRLFLIQSGSLRLVDPLVGRGMSSIFSQGDILGIRACISGTNHTRTAITTTDSKIWTLRRSDLDSLVHQFSELRTNVAAFIQGESMQDFLSNRLQLNQDIINKWKTKAVNTIEFGNSIPALTTSSFDISDHKGAPLAIWLGLALDGIPEALVIGANVSQSTLGLSLLAGLFLSNYPEALSSSIGMKQHGMRRVSILLMWTSLMLMIGVISAFGSLFFGDVSHTTLAITEGIAAGAMLTMIAQTMLPEAYLKGGSIIGFFTLLGFLAAISFKAFE